MSKLSKKQLAEDLKRVTLERDTFRDLFYEIYEKYEEAPDRSYMAAQRSKCVREKKASILGESYRNQFFDLNYARKIPLSPHAAAKKLAKFDADGKATGPSERTIRGYLSPKK